MPADAQAAHKCVRDAQQRTFGASVDEGSVICVAVLRAMARGMGAQDLLIGRCRTLRGDAEGR